MNESAMFREYRNRECGQILEERRPDGLLTELNRRQYEASRVSHESDLFSTLPHIERIYQSQQALLQRSMPAVEKLMKHKLSLNLGS